MFNKMKKEPMLKEDKERKAIYNKHFSIPVLKLTYVKCIKSVDSNFIVGKYYPVIDFNNGWTILGEMIPNRDSYFTTPPFHNFDLELHDPELYVGTGEQEKYAFL